MQVDTHGDVYIAGSSAALADLPQASSIGALQSIDGRTGMFVVKMNATLDTVLFAAMIGGTSQDQVYAMKVDADGNVIDRRLEEIRRAVPATQDAAVITACVTNVSALVRILLRENTTRRLKSGLQYKVANPIHG